MSSETPKKGSREERLAEALRANLRRRKSQARARAQGEAEADAPSGDEDSGADT